jgi:hypothetical protein
MFPNPMEKPAVAVMKPNRLPQNSLFMIDGVENFGTDFERRNPQQTEARTRMSENCAYSCSPPARVLKSYQDKLFYAGD